MSERHAGGGTAVMDEHPMMTWGMGLLWLLAVVVLLLAAAALVKYLFSRGRSDHRGD